MLHKFSRMNSHVKLLTKGEAGGGGRRLGRSCSVTKSVIKQKNKALDISFAKFCRQSSTRKINLDFSLEQTYSLPLKCLILHQNETQGTHLVFPSLRDLSEISREEGGWEIWVRK